VKPIVYLFLFYCLPVSGQLSVDFEDQEMEGWLQFPEGRWEVSGERPLEGNFSLHHGYDNAVGGVDYIGRDLCYPDTTATLHIAFRIRHGYPPSSGNNWQLFFLASDYKDLKAGDPGSSGMMLGVNFTGSDDRIKLWQLSHGEVSEVFATDVNYQEVIGTQGEPSFRLTRDPGGMWTLEMAPDSAGGQSVTIGTGNEHVVSDGKYAGFRYAYSSAQDRKLWVDAFKAEGVFSADTRPPRVVDHRVTGLNSIEVLFSEAVVPLESTRFILDGTGPDSSLFSGRACTLFFRDHFPNRITQQLHIQHIADLEGNVLPDTIIAFRQVLAEFGDVVISEIMTDPEPVVYLPPCEYVELLNRSDERILLEGMTLVINERRYLLGPGTLEPGEYMVVTHPDCSGQYGTVNDQPAITSATALTNGGGTICLLDRYERIIHVVVYEGMERIDPARSDGGWSLERPDPGNLCGGYENWSVSTAWRGGTPGEANSRQWTVPDGDSPVISYMGIPQPDKLTVVFNEYLMFGSGGEEPFGLVGASLQSREAELPVVAGSVELLLDGAMEEGKMYELNISGVSDCAGNLSGPIKRGFRLPVLPEKHLPVISEVMYDPVPGGNEYIELFNHGDDFLDLHDLRLELVLPGTLGGSPAEISQESHLLFPGARVVLTKDGRSLQQEWELGPAVDVVEIGQWRVLPNSGACIRLTDRSGAVLDHCCYHDSLHHDIVSVTSGVALERTIPGPCRTASSCWLSAAASVNYGTPGEKNSQSLPEFSAGEKLLQLNPAVFSPDNDGFEDLLEIILHEEVHDEMVSIFITDLQGNHTRDIVFRGNGGRGDRYLWNGLDQDGRTVLPGIYVVHLVIEGEAGKKIRREPCAVMYR